MIVTLDERTLEILCLRLGGLSTAQIAAVLELECEEVEARIREVEAGLPVGPD